ncbi:hypothetical protein AC1031_008645 [Aphanomyces cochlioides]|nr:hypothetical protein AC1031_008645 [Aphanomyces cochlioides]
MGVSGWGVTGIITMLIAVGMAFICLITPAWFTNTGLSVQHLTVIQHADTNIGLIGMCFDVQFKNDTQNLGITACYPFYGGDGGDYSYVGHTSTPSFQQHKSNLGICSYYHANDVNNKASKELSVMTGMAWIDIDFFIQSTCGSLGKASIAMAVLFLVLTFASLVTLVFVVFCCKNHLWLITFSRVCSTLAAISSVVLSFCVMSQVKGIKSAGDGVDVRYGFCFYFEWLGLVLTIFGAWCIEKHTLAQKTQKVDLI